MSTQPTGILFPRPSRAISGSCVGAGISILYVEDLEPGMISVVPGALKSMGGQPLIIACRADLYQLAISQGGFVIIPASLLAGIGPVVLSLGPSAQPLRSTAQSPLEDAVGMDF